MLAMDDDDDDDDYGYQLHSNKLFVTTLLKQLLDLVTKKRPTLLVYHGKELNVRRP